MNGKLKTFCRSKLNIDNKEFLRECTQELGITREKARKLLDGMHADEIWVNDEYQVNLNRQQEKKGIVHLSIKRLDKEPVHDWRDLQAIKTMLLGPEVEAVEVYPAESRMVDTANQYHLWAFVEEGFKLPFGFHEGRMVHNEMKLANGKQRSLE